MIKNLIGHTCKIFKHKYYVFKYMAKCGMPLRGLMHDMSKFSPIEFWESVKYYQGTSSPIDAAKADKGYSKAWFHHRGRNPHHYEYWTDNFEKGITSNIMPYKYAVEMLCDYLGAARAYMGENFSYQAELKWWEDKSKKVVLMDYRIKTFISVVISWLTYPGVKPEEVLNKRTLDFIYTVSINENWVEDD